MNKAEQGTAKAKVPVNVILHAEDARLVEEAPDDEKVLLKQIVSGKSAALQCEAVKKLGPLLQQQLQAVSGSQASSKDCILRAAIGICIACPPGSSLRKALLSMLNGLKDSAPHVSARIQNLLRTSCSDDASGIDAKLLQAKHISDFLVEAMQYIGNGSSSTGSSGALHAALSACAGQVFIALASTMILYRSYLSGVSSSGLANAQGTHFLCCHEAVKVAVKILLGFTESVSNCWDSYRLKEIGRPSDTFVDAAVYLLQSSERLQIDIDLLTSIAQLLIQTLKVASCADNADSAPASWALAALGKNVRLAADIGQHPIGRALAAVSDAAFIPAAARSCLVGAAMGCVTAAADDADAMSSSCCDRDYEQLLADAYDVLMTCSRSIHRGRPVILMGRVWSSWLNAVRWACANGAGARGLGLSLMGADVESLASTPMWKLMLYAVDLADNSTSAVRHAARVLFRDLISTYGALLKTTDRQSSQPGADRILKALAEVLLVLPWHAKAKYALLGVLAEEAGNLTSVGHLLSLVQLNCQPVTVIDAMVSNGVFCEQSLASSASDFVQRLLRHVGDTSAVAADCSANFALDEPSFLRDWLLPTLGALRNEHSRLHVEEYLLPRLLDARPGSLPRAVQLLTDQLQSSGNERGSGNQLPTAMATEVASVAAVKEDSALVCLVLLAKHARRGCGNSLQTSSTVIPTQLLRLALFHRDDELRLSAFGLLCDDRRSSNPVSAVELGLALAFLHYSAGHELPAYRQSVCAITKKLLLRCRLSFAAQARHGSSRLADDIGTSGDTRSLSDCYRAFLTSLCHQQLDRLYAVDMPYPQRTIALELLTLVAEAFPPLCRQSPAVLDSAAVSNTSDATVIFSVSEIITDSSATSLLACICDTYEHNRAAAARLLLLVLEDVGTQRCGISKQFSAKLPSLIWEEVQCLLEGNEVYDAAIVAGMVKLLVQLTGYKHDSAAVPAVNSPAPDSALAVAEWLLHLLELRLARIHTEGTVEIGRGTGGQQLYSALLCIREVMGLGSSCAAVDDPRLSVGSRIGDRLPQHVLAATGSLYQADFLLRLVKVCKVIYFLISPVVCHCSPEGYEMETDKTDDGANEGGPAASVLWPRQVVVCCWRAAKEIALLFGLIAKQSARGESCPHGCHPLDIQLVAGSIEEFFSDILANARHRGAFEIAYSGHVEVWCAYWRRLPADQLRQRFFASERSPVSVVLDAKLASEACSTRRSAGLPYAVLAYLVSQPPDVCDEHGLSAVMAILLQVAGSRSVVDDEPKDGSNIQHEQSNCKQSAVTVQQKVHAMNILRIIFLNTQLGKRVVPFVSAGIKAAVCSYQDRHWMVRSSATLLFSALVQRVFGVKRSKDDLARRNSMTARAFFSKFPDLYGFLLDQLNAHTKFVSDGGETLLQPGLYLTLLILGKLYPSPTEQSQAVNADLQEECLGHSPMSSVFTHPPSLSGAQAPCESEHSPTGSSASLQPFAMLLSKCIGSPVHKARVMSARALARLSTPDSWPSLVDRLLAHIRTAGARTQPEGVGDPYMPDGTADTTAALDWNASTNFIHGILLALQQVVKSSTCCSPTVRLELTSTVLYTLASSPVVVLLMRCPALASAYFDLVRLVLADNPLHLQASVAQQLGVVTKAAAQQLAALEQQQVAVRPLQCTADPRLLPPPSLTIGGVMAAESAAAVLLELSSRDCDPAAAVDLVRSLLDSRHQAVRVLALRQAVELSDRVSARAGRDGALSSQRLPHLARLFSGLWLLLGRVLSPGSRSRSECHSLASLGDVEAAASAGHCSEELQLVSRAVVHYMMQQGHMPIGDDEILTVAQQLSALCRDSLHLAGDSNSCCDSSERNQEGTFQETTVACLAHLWACLLRHLHERWTSRGLPANDSGLLLVQRSLHDLVRVVEHLADSRAAVEARLLAVACLDACGPVFATSLDRPSHLTRSAVANEEDGVVPHYDSRPERPWWCLIRLLVDASAQVRRDAATAAQSLLHGSASLAGGCGCHHQVGPVQAERMLDLAVGHLACKLLQARCATGSGDYHGGGDSVSDAAAQLTARMNTCSALISQMVAVHQLLDSPLPDEALDEAAPDGTSTLFAASNELAVGLDWPRLVAALAFSLQEALGTREAGSPTKAIDDVGCTDAVSAVADCCSLCCVSLRGGGAWQFAESVACVDSVMLDQAAAATSLLLLARDCPPRLRQSLLSVTAWLNEEKARGDCVGNGQPAVRLQLPWQSRLQERHPCDSGSSCSHRCSRGQLLVRHMCIRGLAGSACAVR